MTAPPLHLANDAPAAPLGEDWLPVAEAARRLGRDAGHVRRMCKEKWERLALATKRDGDWFIHVGADPKLKRSAVTAEPSDDPAWRALPHKVRAEAQQKAQCVASFRQAKTDRPGRVEDWIEQLAAQLSDRYPFNVTRASLYRWNKQAGDPIDPYNLVNGRRIPQAQRAKAEISPEAISYFVEIYLDQRRPSLQLCHERAADYAARHGLTWCESYYQARRLAEKLIDQQTRLRHREPAKYRSTCEPWIERDPESFAANECWVSDHRPLDILCYAEDQTSGGGKRRSFRPYLTVWQDWRTRYILGWALVETPNTESILAALRMALLNPACAGPPRYVWIDNGKDYDSYTLQGLTKAQRRKHPRNQGEMIVEGEQTIFPGVFGLLHIEPHHAIPYRGQGKARCERVFATVAARFDVSFPTYTGKDTLDKPEDLKMHIAAGRAPHFDDVKDRLSKWIDGHNQSTAHSIKDLADPELSELGDGRLSRLDAYTGWSAPAVMPDARTLEMICHVWPAPPSGQLGRKVTRNGLTVTIGGTPVRYGQHDEALGPFKQTKREVVCCYDPADINQLYVFDQQMALVTVAQRNSTVGRYIDPMTADQLKDATRQRAAYEKAGKVRKQHREHEYLTTEEIAADKAAKRQRKAQVDRRGDGTIRLVQTRLDDASKQLQKRQLKAAAGCGGGDAGGAVEIEGQGDDLLDVGGGAAGLARAFASQQDDLGGGDDLDAPFVFEPKNPATFAGSDTDVDDLLDGSPLSFTDDDDDAGDPHLLDELP